VARELAHDIGIVDGIAVGSNTVCWAARNESGIGGVYSITLFATLLDQFGQVSSQNIAPLSGLRTLDHGIYIDVAVTKDAVAGACSFLFVNSAANQTTLVSYTSTNGWHFDTSLVPGATLCNPVNKQTARPARLIYDPDTDVRYVHGPFGSGCLLIPSCLSSSKLVVFCCDASNSIAVNMYYFTSSSEDFESVQLVDFSVPQTLVATANEESWVCYFASNNGFSNGILTCVDSDEMISTVSLDSVQVKLWMAGSNWAIHPDDDETPVTSPVVPPMEPIESPMEPPVDSPVEPPVEPVEPPLELVEPTVESSVEPTANSPEKSVARKRRSLGASASQVLIHVTFGTESMAYLFDPSTQSLIEILPIRLIEPSGFTADISSNQTRQMISFAYAQGPTLTTWQGSAPFGGFTSPLQFASIHQSNQTSSFESFAIGSSDVNTGFLVQYEVTADSQVLKLIDPSQVIVSPVVPTSRRILSEAAGLYSSAPFMWLPQANTLVWATRIAASGQSALNSITADSSTRAYVV